MSVASAITINYESARHFVNALRLSDSAWLEDDAIESTWIFRGCSDEDYELLPKAFRTSTAQHPLYEMVAADPLIPSYVEECVRNERPKFPMDDDCIGKLKTIAIQALFEQKLMDSFSHFLNDVGHSTGQRLKRPERDNRVTKKAIWRSCNPQFPEVLHDLGIRDALAQHHGLPTRMLDWTFNPLTAAYFATHRLNILAAPVKHISRSRKAY